GAAGVDRGGRLPGRGAACGTAVRDPGDRRPRGRRGCGARRLLACDVPGPRQEGSVPGGHRDAAGRRRADRGAGRAARRGRRGQTHHLGGLPVPAGAAVSAPLLLLDGASMWFRSYFALPSSITAPDGRPVNAVRGFLDTVANLISRERPARLVVCRDDDWRTRWRVVLVPSYQAHRVLQESPGDDTPDVEDVPGGLTPQEDMIFALLDAFGIATAGAPGYEADDVLGTLAARERRDPVLV